MLRQEANSMNQDMRCKLNQEINKLQMKAQSEEKEQKQKEQEIRKNLKWQKRCWMQRRNN